MTISNRHRHKACPGKELKGEFRDYLTDTFGWERIIIHKVDQTPFKWKQKGIDTDEFRKQCEDIDKGE